MDSTGTQQGLEVSVESQDFSRQTDWRRWRELGLVILIAIAPATLAAFSSLFYPTSHGPNTFPARNFGFSWGLLHQASSLLLVIYVLGRRGLSLRSLGLNFSRWIDLPVALGLAIAGFVLVAVISVIVRHYSSSGQGLEMRDARTIFAGASPILLLIYSATSAVFEETVVRGYVTTELIGLAWPVWLASLASVLLQTSYHVYYGLGGALVVSGHFIVSALYFSISRRLLPVILGHLIVDFTAVGLNSLR